MTELEKLVNYYYNEHLKANEKNQIYQSILINEKMYKDKFKVVILKYNLNYQIDYNDFILILFNHYLTNENSKI